MSLRKSFSIRAYRVKVPQREQKRVLSYVALRTYDGPATDAYGCLSVFHKAYYNWCRAAYMDLSLAGQIALVNAALDRLTPEDFVRGTRALFGPQLRWVKSKTLNFIVDEEKWSRFVAPALASERGVTEPETKHRSKVTRREF